MSDFMPDSPHISRTYCPTCEPTADVLRDVLQVSWCSAHEPDRSGELDRLVNSEGYLASGASESGEGNKAWCDFLHRRRV